MYVLLAALTARAAVVDRVAAVVEDQVIMLSQVYELGAEFIAEKCGAPSGPCVDEAELEVLDALIKRALVREELERLDMQVTGTDVDQAIDRILEQYGLEDRQTLRTE